MIKKISIGLLILALSTSCVSKKIYTDLETKFADLKKENRAISDENAALLASKKQLESEKAALQTNLDDVNANLAKVQADYEAAKNKMKIMQDSYAALEKNSNESLEANMKKNRELLAQLDAKAKALALEQEKLNASSQRLKELEDLIASKEASMKKLKETLSKALNGFEGKGLTVEQKNGKVYGCMEN